MLLKPKLALCNNYSSPISMTVGELTYIFQGANPDRDDVRIINPNDGMIIGRPKLEVEYPLLASFAWRSRSYYRNALVTNRDIEGTGRDNDSVSMFCRS